ncbi:WD repeat-containing protein 38 isoform X3 [Odocoileus virginianus]|uniref:WD repeat-containing protein 38 isoform X3 n=1 Tax=Odocoileus virginianus TaxID=9874 RepID=A0A6J0VXP4_ODOVR
MNSGTRGKLAVGRVKFFGRHRGEVNSSAFSPDGQRLLTASEDGCVYGWETQSGRLLWRLGGHKGPVRFCRFSPDGRLFASTSCDRTIRLWDAADAKCLQVLKGHQRSVETVSFSHDSKQLASGGWDKRVMLWEVQSGQVLRHFVGHRDSVQSSDFAPSSDCLLVPASCGHSQLRKQAPCSGQLSAGHWLLGFYHPHVGPPGRDPWDLPSEAGGSERQHQLPVLLTIWPTGIWLLGQDHSHLEALNAKRAHPAQGPHHLGEEHSFLP